MKLMFVFLDNDNFYNDDDDDDEDDDNIASQVMPCIWIITYSLDKVLLGHIHAAGCIYSPKAFP